MNRVYGPALVGNDMISMSKGISTKRSFDARRTFVFPSVQEKEQSSHYNSVPAPIYEAPSMGYMSSAAPEGMSYSPRFLNKSRLTLFIIVLALITLAVGSIAEKQVILTFADKVKTISQQVSQDIATHKATAPTINPRQLIIHSSDYDSAMADLMTQSITLNIGSSSQTVNSGIITNWLNIKNQGPLTYISVRSSNVTSYLNQITNSNKQYVSAVKSATNQIANNVLKAKGMTVTLLPS